MKRFFFKQISAFIIILFCVPLTFTIDLTHEYRLSVDTGVSPYLYESSLDMQGLSFNGSVMSGLKVNRFTFGLEVFETYASLDSTNHENYLRGAWNSLRFTFDFYAELSRWFEVKGGIGVCWFSSAYMQYFIGTVGNSQPGVSSIVEAAFKPWDFFSIKGIFRIDWIFPYSSPTSNFVGLIRCEFHPVIDWLSLYIEGGEMSWINTKPRNDMSVLDLKAAIFVWSIGASIDITFPSSIKKMKEKFKKIEKKDKNKE